MAPDLATLLAANGALRTALLLLLDHVDYTAGACDPTEQVAAALPEEIIRFIRFGIAANDGVVSA